MSNKPPLTEKQERAMRIVNQLLTNNFSNHVVIADSMKIDGRCYTTWNYAGNVSAVIGMMERYKSAILHYNNTMRGEADEE